jgi:hypothetical protein
VSVVGRNSWREWRRSRPAPSRFDQDEKSKQIMSKGRESVFAVAGLLVIRPITNLSRAVLEPKTYTGASTIVIMKAKNNHTGRYLREILQTRPEFARE